MLWNRISICSRRIALVSLAVFFLIGSTSFTPVSEYIDVISDSNVKYQVSEMIDLSGAQIALWHTRSGYQDWWGTSSSLVDGSIVAPIRMFEWMGTTVSIVTMVDICIGCLDDYDLLLVPGGVQEDYIAALGTTGRDVVQNWVASGGCYVGICAGASIGTSGRIREGEELEAGFAFFQGNACIPVDHMRNDYEPVMKTLVTNIDCTGPDLSGEPSTHQVAYYNGAYFVPNAGYTDYHEITAYQENGEAAMVAFEYGTGCVFLSGVHPEIEEDSDRDGGTWDDVFDDEGSEWDMMKGVVLWMLTTATPAINATTDTTSTNTTIISTTPGTITDESPLQLEFLAVGIGAPVILIALLIVWKTKR
ncbi:MAG: hypothetical protein EAX81_07415 [Candidatus Thorarchaeota archaeon]|nr:hypothetical protein [Candidatus Thorarchaeota archaeon]